MGQITNGILGGFSGKVGPVSGYTRNGRSIMRTAASTVTDEPTEKRVAQRGKIKVANRFMFAFKGKDLFKKSFPAYGHGGSGYNRAMGNLMNKAIKGSYPDIIISYDLVSISKGLLPGAENAAAVANDEGNILFSWANNTGTGTAKADDTPILVAYFHSLNEIIYSLNNGTREAGNALLKTSVLKGYAAETWIGFLSENSQDAADSVYTGLVSL